MHAKLLRPTDLAQSHGMCARMQQHDMRYTTPHALRRNSPHSTTPRHMHNTTQHHHIHKPQRSMHKPRHMPPAGPYSPTVKVPVTEFSLRANSVAREPEVQQYWAQHHVYESLVEGNPGVSSLREAGEQLPGNIGGDSSCPLGGCGAAAWEHWWEMQLFVGKLAGRYQETCLGEAAAF